MMRLSPKELMIRKLVKVKPFVFVKGQFCGSCSHYVRFEKMYHIPTQEGHYCTHCHNTKEHLYNEVFMNKEVTAQDIIIRNEKAKVRKALDNLIHDISELPDGDVSPSVDRVLMAHQITMNHVNKPKRKKPAAKRPRKKTKKAVAIPRPTT